MAGVPVYTSPSTCCQYVANPESPTDWMITPHPPGYRVIEAGALPGQGVTTRVVWVPAAMEATAASL